MKTQFGLGWGQVYYSTSGGLGASTFNLNAALSGGYSANWWAAYIVPLQGGTVSKIRVYCSAVTGTLVSGDLVCDLYSESNGNPNTSLQSSTTVTTIPTGAAWVEFTDFSTALTAGTPYFIVLRNADATPASNAITYVSYSNLLLNGNITDPQLNQAAVFTSTNSGSTWTRLVNIPPVVIDYGSGVVEGFPIQGAAQGGSSLQIYSSREAGIKFTTPENAKLNISGIIAVILKTGTPTGNLRYRIYSSNSTTPTLTATTLTRTAGQVSGSRSAKYIPFSSVVTLDANTVVRIVASETTQSDTSSNRFTLDEITLSSSDTGLILPYTVQPASTLSTDGGANFTDTADRIPIIWPVLDGEAPFTATSSGGSGGAFTFIG
jgi:hypothetical protein